MPSSRVPPSHLHGHHDSSPEPAAFLSPASQSQPTTHASVRRNLFSAHLSRRPASGSQSVSQATSSSSHSTSQNSMQGQSQDSNLQSRTHGQTQQQRHNTTVPHHAVHAASRRYQHQRSVSTPSLSPSPPRLSPFHHLPPPGTFQHQAPPPSMVPTPPRQMTDRYDPTTSPHRPLSPRSKDALFPNSSIIAINPTTGRPVLPHMPTLPSRLRLSDDEADLESESGHQSQHYGQDTHQYDDERGHDDTQNSYSRSHRHPQQAHHHIPPRDTDISPVAGMGPSTHTAAQLRAEEEAEIEADEERRDRERIERLLREMMARQRARAKSKTSVTDSHTPTSSANRRGGRRRAHDVGVDMEPSELELGDESESEAEKEELMSLITASLRREVAKADDENWMFGDLGAPGSALSRDEGLVD